jgi:hypothetical protein
VVYGRSALAASVSDLRVRVSSRLVPRSEESSDDIPSIVIQLHDLPSSVDGCPLRFSASVADVEASLGFLAGFSNL